MGLLYYYYLQEYSYIYSCYLGYTIIIMVLSTDGGEKLPHPHSHTHSSFLKPFVNSYIIVEIQAIKTHFRFNIVLAFALYPLPHLLTFVALSTYN